ncbi:MAG: hypothetical protein JWQ83_1291, partial [Lacunisphaera sp.]|nr:hypothetical protein [Lacunisphaera sp.]
KIRPSCLAATFGEWFAFRAFKIVPSVTGDLPAALRGEF